MAFDNGILGQRIKTCRQAAGISQEKVAELVGVSRQAVTKWETGQSAPSTENLFKLAEIFGTTVDLILTANPAEAAEDGREIPTSQKSIAEQMYELQKQDEARRAEERRQRLRRNALAALLVAAAYILYYLAGRVLCVHYGDASVKGWLFVNDWSQIDYLYGWLLSSSLFWYAAAVSVIGAALGKYRFSSITAAAFGAGWLFGELLGPNPEGIPLGHGHYGWAIWGGVFLVGILVGIAAEVIWNRKKKLHIR